MKYILEENIKHILSERFILNEALDYDQLVKQCNALLNYIKKLLKDADTKSDSDTDKADTKLKMTKAAELVTKKTNELIHALNNVKDATIAKGRFDEYKNTAESMFTTIDPDYKNNTGTIYKAIEDIEDLFKDNSDFKVLKNNLIKQLQKFVPIISTVSSKLSTVEDSDTGDAYDSAAQKDILQTIYADIFRLSQISKENYDQTIRDIFSPIIELLVKRMTEAVADDSKKVNFLRVCKATEEAEGELRLAMQKNSKLFSTTSGTDILNSMKGGMDWGKRYASASDKAVVWKQYLQAVWKEYANDIEALGEPFRQECEKLGFNEASNPFIAFLKKYLVEKHYPIDRPHYFAIHNAVAHGYLTKTDVIKPGDPLTEANNIIFWEDFYLKGSSADYLEILGSLRSTSFNFDELKNIVTENVPEANKILFDNISKWINDENKNKSNLIYVLMSDTNSLNDLLTIADYKIQEPAQRLRSIAELDQLLQALDVTVAKKKAFNTTNINTLINTLENTAPYKDDLKAWAPKIIRRIADAAGSDITSIRAYDSLVRSYPILQKNDTRYTWKEGQDILKLLSDIGGDIDWPMLGKIAKEFNDPPREWLK